MYSLILQLSKMSFCDLFIDLRNAKSKKRVKKKSGLAHFIRATRKYQYPKAPLNK